MKDLVTAVLVEAVPPLTPEDFVASATAPMDPLQTWLVQHALCGGAQFDRLTLEPLAQREDGSREVVARCQWCDTSTGVVVDCGPRDVSAWWVALLAHIFVKYRAVLVPDGWVDYDEFRRCFLSLESAIRLCVLLDEAAQSDVTH